ncbi:MAG TPA: hypothetical protein VMV77_09030 [Bacteroidales bacterium]|nr:hypothetical protein [Bacteroidales bacterium]
MATDTCQVCGGNGWYTDHSNAHYANPQITDCFEFGCPVQVECEECNGTGYVIIEINETE